MKRILFLVPRMNMGGAETYVYTVVKQLKNRGQYEVFVASGGGKFAEKLEELGVKTFFVPVRFSKKLSVFLLKRIVQKHKIDLLHANSGNAGVVASLLKKEINIPVVYTAHGIFGNIEREHIIDTVDKIICVSNFVRERALNQGFTSEKLLTKYCGVDTKRFRPNDAFKAELREKYGIAKDTLVLATVSRIKNLQHKGHESLLELFEKYAKDKDWKLVVVGKGNG
jgi:glycosyltransferase involved in cell wall biosynthesis